MIELNVRLTDDQSLLSDVISALPVRIESTLNQFRTKLLGSLPATREDFDPSILLGKVEGGEKIITLDSMKDLKEDWHKEDLRRAVGLHQEINDDGAVISETVDPIEDQVVRNPARVLIFTTSLLLSLLAVCKMGSVDGTFKSMTKKWRQLFVFMVNYRGAFIPIAFGWLPNKAPVSYHIFLYLLLSKFLEQSATVSDNFGSSICRLRKVCLDFEESIHVAFERFFKLKGCFFHFSKAIWRRVRKLKLVRAYMNDKKFKTFVRSLVAIPFLPLNQIREALRSLAVTEFPRELESSKFKLIEYLEKVWLVGKFPPKMWNLWGKSKELTNNRNEGYNSRVNKIVASYHPNPWILLNKVIKELLKAETDAIYIKVKTKQRLFYNERVVNCQRVLTANQLTYDFSGHWLWQGTSMLICLTHRTH